MDVVAKIPTHVREIKVRAKAPFKHDGSLALCYDSANRVRCFGRATHQLLLRGAGRLMLGRPAVIQESEQPYNRKFNQNEQINVVEINHTDHLLSEVVQPPAGTPLALSVYHSLYNYILAYWLPFRDMNRW
jgi:hypothetical protein